jgi:hypothetical protein
MRGSKTNNRDPTMLPDQAFEELMRLLGQPDIEAKDQRRRSLAGQTLRRKQRNSWSKPS